MSNTDHFHIPLPDENSTIADEMYRLRAAFEIVDSALSVISNAVAGKAATDHKHEMSDVNELVDALAAKMAADKKFSIAELVDVIGASEAGTGYVLAKDANEKFSFLSAANALGNHNHNTSQITGLDSALSGRYTKSEVDNALSQKAAQSTTYSKTDVDNLITAGGVPIGASVFWNSTTIPVGFLKENGAAISRTTYSKLFAVIGTTFGAGNGSTTFNLPDSRGEFIRGLDDGRGIDASRSLGSAQDDQNKSHTHTATTSSAGAHTHTLDRGSEGSTWGTKVDATNSTSDNGTVTTSSSGAHTHTVTVAANGGTEARPRNVAKLILIRAY